MNRPAFSRVYMEAAIMKEIDNKVLDYTKVIGQRNRTNPGRN